MKVLFGRPRLEYCESVNGVPTGEWIAIDTPKEDTTSIDTNEGADVEASEEGGELIDRLSDASSYTLTFELFKKKGEAMPLSNRESRGVVYGEYAIRVLSDIDSEVPGIQFDRCSVKTARLYTPNDTYRRQYKFAALKPPTGDTIKEIENTRLDFTYVTASKVVTVLNYGNLVFDTPVEWVTVTSEGREITITVAQNEVKAPRSTQVLVTDTASNIETILTIEQGKCPDFLLTLSGGYLLTASGNRIIINK